METAQPAPTAPSRAESTIRAYARSARLAVWVQLGAAALAFLAIVVFGFMIQNSVAKLNEVNTQLDTQKARLDASHARIATADKATKAVLQATAALATHEPEQYDGAVKSLDAVSAELAQGIPELEERLAKDEKDPLAHQQDEEAIRQLRDVRANVSSTLASVLYTRPSRSDDDLGRAISLESENLRDDGLRSEQVYASTIALATFQCERNKDDEVRKLLNPGFVARFPKTGSDPSLPKRCRDLAGVKAPEIAAFNPDKADANYRIKTILFQISQESDRVWAAQLAEAYCRAGYDVPGIEKVDAKKVKAGGELLYYFDQQASEATSLAEVAAPPLAWTAPTVRHLAGFDNLNPHTAELWLPASAAASRLPPAEIDRLKKVKRCSPPNQQPATQIAGLVAQLSSDNKADRLSAGQVLANQIRGADDAALVAALLGQLEGDRLETISAAGRLNVLYMLNVEPDWSSRADKRRLTNALNNLDTRQKTKGMVIGGQTRDCINQLRLKLQGQPASDRCGGL